MNDDGFGCGTAAIASHPVETLIEVGPVDFAFGAGKDDVVAVEENGVRNGVTELKLIEVIRCRAGPHRKCNLQVLYERGNIFLRLAVVERSGNKHDALRTPNLFRVHQHGHFFFAGQAPGGPDVEYDWFAGKVVQMHFLAVETGQSK